MALVSPSPPPPASLYPPAQPLFARASGEPPVAALRSATLSAASSPPPTVARPAGAMHESAHTHAGSAGAGPAHSQSRGQLAAGSPNVRPLPSPQPARARTTSAPFPDAATAPHLQQQQQHASAAAFTGAADLPPPVLVPSRSSSTPPSSGSSSRPSPAPTPSTRTSSSSLRSASHAHSASNSSSNSPSSSTFALPPVPGVPRLAPAHFAAGASSPSLTSSPQSYLPQQQQHHHHAQQLHMAQVAAHPTFAGQPFPPFAPAYPHPAYPFIPSPHPNGPNGAMGFPAGGAFGPGAANTLQLNAEQQKRMQQYQHQWQMEVLKSQQQQQQVQGDGQRRRATSGPAPSHTGSYYTTPVGYPAMPSPSHQQLPFGMTSPSLPPGAMLPQFNVHGYPTPPGSLDGARSNGGGAESSSSSGGSAPSRAEAFHPYRRGGDDRRHGHGHGERSTSAHRSAGSGSAAGAAGRRTPTHLQQHSRGESIASLASQHMYAPQDLPAPALPRSDSSSSVNSAARTSGSSSPSGSARHVPLPSTSSSSSASSLSRQRTESQNSSSSSVHQQQLHQRPPSALRGASFDSARSATPVQANVRGARPSPLAAPQVTDESEDDDGAESDGTAEATATISTGLVASPTITSIASTATATTAAAGATPKGKEKEKEKKGMKSRFKKAFGVSNSSSSTTLGEFDVDGRGPKQLAAGPNGSFRPRRDSSSSSETASTTAPRTPPGHGAVGAVPYATHQQHPSVASSAASVLGDGMSTTTGGANGKKPPSSRFRLLNNKFNGSSDNLSISSTVSSASVMIRKLGQMGKLARRNSLMGLTKAFKKDKNKDGAADDSGFEASSSAASFAGVAPTNKLSKKDKKKGFAADASVSHATAEYDSSAFSSSNGVPNGMSPAAALARRQQQQYAEQEAAEERARQAAAEEAARLGPPLRSFEQLPAHVRADSAGSDVSSVKSGKNGAGKAGKKWRLGFGGSKTDLHETSSLSSDATAVERGASALGQYEDATPRQSLEVLAPQQQGAYQTYGANYVERDSSQEYEPSLYREGATPKPISAKAVRGILKGAATYRQEDFVAPRAPFARTRASSFDAPQQQARPGSPGGAALVNVIPSEQQVDGVGPMATSPRADTHPPTHIDEVHDNAAARIHPDASSSAGGVYTHPSMNASAPALNHFTSSPSMRPTPPGTAASRRRITFASNLSVHTTWPAAIYDRRAEPATCNRLTPLLAQQIKEELNSFKMEEMDVHPLSRKLTHFFV
ncbi:hypothetical protein Rhopal_005435-T1 [Rhodotorula paludigena]|uniref:Protein BNI4 n=1 Tax=Rhodotorula paludigena TaxID=86838 RepID=A0AAV5GID6_9BASI|nr:hypothetical protein Rhopal_005435-T1 [Rhodotorula paludigena]